MSTLADKSQANKTAIENEINQTTPALPAAFNKVLSDQLAVAQQSIEKVVTRAELENLVKTATLRENGGKLNDIGEERDIIYKQATSAVLNVQIPAVNGTEITPQYSLSGDNNGLDYLLASNHIATGGFLTFPVTCIEPGPNGNLEPTNTLTLSAPLSGVQGPAEVVDTDTVGASAEGQDNYRIRILDEIRNPGEAGNLSFYRKRGKNAAGVQQIYPYRGLLTGTTFINPGDISCWVEATTEIDPDGVPTQAVLDAAEEAIVYDETGEIQKLPTTTRELHMFAIQRDEVFFTISNLTVFDSGQLGDAKADIESALDTSLRLMAAFIPGLDFVKDKNDTLSVPTLSGIVDDVVKTYSGSYDGLFFGFQAGQFSNTTILQPGQLVKRGPVTYV